MQKTLIIAVVAGFVGAIGLAAPNLAFAGSDKAMKAEDCAKITDAAKKKECMAQASKTKATKAEKAGKSATGKDKK